jgi:hypothetical protein
MAKYKLMNLMRKRRIAMTSALGWIESVRCTIVGGSAKGAWLMSCDNAQMSEVHKQVLLDRKKRLLAANEVSMLPIKDGCMAIDGDQLKGKNGEDVASKKGLDMGVVASEIINTYEEEAKYDAGKEGEKSKEEDSNKGAVICREERRRSERNQKDITLTTEEKNMNMAKKRNLEGNNVSSENSFAALHTNEIREISKSIGVMIPDNDFAIINLVKEMELARHSLAQKNKKVVVREINSEDDQESGVEPAPEDELADFEGFVVVTPKRKRKANVRNIQSLDVKDRSGKENPAPKRNPMPR